MRSSLESRSEESRIETGSSGAVASSIGCKSSVSGSEPFSASFRNWPSWLFFSPIAGRWLWQGALHGDLSLPAIANPLANDGSTMSAAKSAVFASLGSEARGWVAPYVVIRGRGKNEPESMHSQALCEMEKAGLAFPLVAKPDRGTGGSGVRVVADETELRSYILRFPSDQDLMLQQKVDHSHEAGIMYMRHPADRHGRIVALALKEAPAVTGDGSATLRELIERHPHSRHARRHAFAEHAERLETIPSPGEHIELVFARNRGAGAVCRDGRGYITPALEQRIDEIARTLPCFHVGRFDIRFESPDRLRSGDGFKILEINCGASEPIHAWDPGNNVFQVWRAYFDQVDGLFQLGAANRKLGYPSVGTLPFLHGLWRQSRQKRAHPNRS